MGIDDILLRPEFIFPTVVLITVAAVGFALARRGNEKTAPEGPAETSTSVGPKPWTVAPPKQRLKPEPQREWSPEKRPAREQSAPAKPVRQKATVGHPPPEESDSSRNTTIVMERPTTTFGDAAGVDEAIDELREIKDYLTEPEPFRALGAKLPKGVLLFGPPGVGKTLLARALAGEANAAFYSVSASSFVQVYVGLGAARVRELFAEAKKNRPAIIFVDELDAIGRRRGGAAPSINEEREGTLNQLLIELDGFDPGTGVLVLGATNRVDILDPALLRSGRFDRRLELTLPDLDGRKAILRVHTVDKPLADDVDLDRLAGHTVGLSGADLANVVNEAALLAARRRHRKISADQFMEAVERVLAGPARRTRLLTVEDRKRVAYHEVGHAVAAATLPAADPVRKITVVARGRGGGFTWFTPESDRLLATRSQLLDRLAAMLAGKVCEEMSLGEPSTGASDDLARASELAREMVTRLGMHPMVNMTISGAVGGEEGPIMTSERMAARIDSEIETTLVEAQTRAHEILDANRDVIEALVDELLAKESIEGPDLDAHLRKIRACPSAHTPAPRAKWRNLEAH